MKRIENLEEVRARMPGLPADFQEWCRDQFKDVFNLYVGNITLWDDYGQELTKGRKGYCSFCRRYFDAPKELKAGVEGICPICRNHGHTFSMTQKRIATQHYQTVWSGDDLGDGIFVLRGFRVRLLQWSPYFKSPEEYTDQIEINETRRLYIAPDAMATEYCGWRCTDYVYDKWEMVWQRAGGENTNNAGPLYPTIYEDAKGTAAEYAFIDKAEELFLFDSDPIINTTWSMQIWYRAYSVWDYLRAYAQDRKLEMLLKMDMLQLVKRRMMQMPIHHNFRGTNPWDYLRVYKCRLKLIAEQTDWQYLYLTICQEERKSGEHWDEEMIEIMSCVVNSKSDLSRIFSYMTRRQFCNRVKTYMKRHKMNLRECVNLYLDYLTIKDGLGFDMENTIYQFPKNLRDAHLKANEEKTSKDLDVKIAIAERKYKNIQKRFEKAKKIYTYEAEGLIIRPAKNAGEIVAEGRYLHHCVGGDNYLIAHNTGKDIILFLRKQEDPDTPYVTVELEPNGEIRQWYGKCDRKTNAKVNDKWLKDYIKKLNRAAVSKEMKEQNKKGAKVG